MNDLRLSLFALSLSVTLSAAESPNIVVILTDDQGWGDVGIHGNTNLSTPHLDSLARDGARFENFYVCPVCAPTRAEFLTGRYHQRGGVNGVSTGDERLEPGEVTIAEVLRDSGYATGIFGKWHNGTQPPYDPNSQGFDEFYGFTSGHWGHYFSPPLEHNGEIVRGDGFVVDDFTTRALQFIEENRDGPFFCYLPYNTPHSPMFVPDRFFEKFAEWEPGMRNHDAGREDVAMTRAALALCENIDWNVGRILDRLDENGLREDTIVLFFCDNGPNSWRWNGGMRGKKGSTDEGGVRSPLFVRWPGQIEPGRSIPQVTGAIDLLPTLAEFAGIASFASAGPLDGRSFASLLTGTSAQWEPRLLFNGWRNRLSVRSDRFRLDDKGRLFDIANDRGQTVDVSARFPEIAAELQAAAQAHREEMNQSLATFADRPFAVGHESLTRLPARDGVAHGTIERSSKAPNNSFFRNWTSEEDAITWDVEVADSASFRVTAHITCREQDVGVTVRLESENGAFVEAVVTEPFDPPLYDKSKERVAESHYWVKDFQPVDMGELRLERGRHTLRLSAPRIPGAKAVDVHSLELRRTE